MSETWLPIPGYEGHYEASDYGRIRALDRITDTGRRWSGRMLTPSSMPTGYKVVTLWRHRKQRTQLVHRLVLLAFVGQAPEGTEALHKDGDHANNRLTNLQWGTHSQNQFDQVKHGKHPHASKNHCPVGHPYDDENTYVYPGKPHRGCRTCRREYQREYQRQLRAKNRKAA